MEQRALKCCSVYLSLCLRCRLASTPAAVPWNRRQCAIGLMLRMRRLRSIRLCKMSLVSSNLSFTFYNCIVPMAFFFHGKFGLLHQGKASCDIVALPNLYTLLIWREKKKTFYICIVAMGFSHGKFGLPSPGKASCDRVALPNPSHCGLILA